MLTQAEHNRQETENPMTEIQNQQPMEAQTETKVVLKKVDSPLFKGPEGAEQTKGNIGKYLLSTSQDLQLLIIEL